MSCICTQYSRIWHVVKSPSQFPYVTSSHHHPECKNQQSGHLQKDSASDSRFLSLVSCEESVAKGWSVEVVGKDLHHVCWKKNPGTSHFCLYKRNLFMEEKLVSEPHFQGKSHLLTSPEAESICLEASASQRRTSEEFKRGSLSPCKWVANQVLLWLPLNLAVVK